MEGRGGGGFCVSPRVHELRKKIFQFRLLGGTEGEPSKGHCPLKALPLENSMHKMDWRIEKEEMHGGRRWGKKRANKKDQIGR